MYHKVKAYVDASFKGKHIQHFDRTVHWLKKLRPDADDALLIAAYAHDIERSFRIPEKKDAYHKSKEGFRDKEMLGHHQEKGAEIIGEFLKAEGVDEATIRRVKHLVSSHEVGGDKDQNLLKDCDSISFFETNAERFVKEYAPRMGKEKVKAKFDWMFERITSPEAKAIARPFYERWLHELEKIMP